MNTESAKKAREFSTIVRRESDGAVIVKVPGHNGRFYYVRVTEQTVTCRWGKKDSWKNCPSIGSHTVCYHGLAAYEKVHGPLSWCESAEDAKRLENLGKHTVEVRSTQDSQAKAWAVLEGKPVSQEDRNARILMMAESYLRLHSLVIAGRPMTSEQREQLEGLRRQFGIMKWNHSRIVNFVRDASIRTIEKAKSLTGTSVDYASMI